jgi:hypothetical protein
LISHLDNRNREFSRFGAWPKDRPVTSRRQFRIFTPSGIRLSE